MSILIKGMEMPDNCYVCPFMFHQKRVPEVWCTAIENHWLDLREVHTCDRHDDCPIVSVTAHGRLIDADAEAARVKNLYNKAVAKDPEMGCVSVYEGEIAVLKLAPTVIPAEEGET